MAFTNISEQKSAVPEAPVTPSAVVNGGRSLSRPQVNSQRVRIENFNNEATPVKNPNLQVLLRQAGIPSQRLLRMSPTPRAIWPQRLRSETAGSSCL